MESIRGDRSFQRERRSRIEAMIPLYRSLPKPRLGDPLALASAAVEIDEETYQQRKRWRQQHAPQLVAGLHAANGLGQLPPSRFDCLVTLLLQLLNAGVQLALLAGLLRAHSRFLELLLSRVAFGLAF